MASEVSICNMALTRIGQSRILSLGQTGILGELSTLYYQPTLDELVTMYEWPFAINRDSLSALTSTNMTAYDNKYQLPLDCLRVLTMLSDEDYSDITDSWEIEGDVLYSDKTPAYIKYIQKVTNPSKLPQVFIEALYLKIASKMVLKITQDQSLMSMIYQEYVAAIQTAMASLGGNSRAKEVTVDWWGS